MAKRKRNVIRRVWGKRKSELTPDELREFTQAARLATYYRRHATRKAQTRKDVSWRKVDLFEVLGIPAACSRCGYDKCIGALDFHHRDPETKLGNVMGMPKDKRVDEARKCDVLCKNCHAEHHANTTSVGAPLRELTPKMRDYLRAVGVEVPHDPRPQPYKRSTHESATDGLGNRVDVSKLRAVDIYARPTRRVLKDNGGSLDVIGPALGQGQGKVTTETIAAEPKRTAFLTGLQVVGSAPTVTKLDAPSEWKNGDEQMEGYRPAMFVDPKTNTLMMGCLVCGVTCNAKVGYCEKHWHINEGSMKP